MYWYHGTDSASAAKITANGLNVGDFLASIPDDPRGVFVTPDPSDAGDYARLRTFDRNNAITPKGKLTPVILVADSKDIGKFLQPVPGGIAGEMHIPVADFPLVPKDAFQRSGIMP